MRHDRTAMIPPPDPKLPPSFVVLMVQTLVVLLFFNPAPTANATAVRSDNEIPSEVWTPPVEGATPSDVVKAFVPPQMPWSAAHRGVDIRAPGTDIVAPSTGEISFIGVVVDRPVLSIRHSNGLISSFEPVDTELEIGDSVSQGQVIGTLSEDATHCDSQCVHWGVRKPDAWQIGSSVRDLYIDPAFLLGWSEPSILWPVHSDPPH